jgi:isopentenyldiphosphate isomerase
MYSTTLESRTPREPMAADELFDIVSEDGEIIGRAPRAHCHGDPSLLHRVAHVLLFRSNGDLVLQYRPAWKDIQPDTWDSSVGGHFDLGESPDEAAARELREELGLCDIALTFRYRYVWRSAVESELVYTYTAIHDGPLDPDPHEVPEARDWTPAQIDAALGSGRLTPNFEVEWQRCQPYRPRGL